MKRKSVILLGLFMMVIMLFAIACKEETAKEVTVSFVTGTEEVIEDITRTVGERYGKLPTPTRDEYDFKGWYTRETGGFDITADTIVTKTVDHSLYARWMETGETITSSSSSSEKLNSSASEDSSWEESSSSEMVSSSTEQESSSVEEPPFVDLALGVAEQKVATSDVNSYVIDKEGFLWAWGKNDCGQVGDGTYINRDMPVRIIKDKKFSFVLASCENAFAIDCDGGLWAWGSDYSATPKQILPEEKFYKVSASYRKFEEHIGVCAIAQDGCLWTWGSILNYRSGDGLFPSGFFYQPERVAEDMRFIDVSISDTHVLAVDANNNLWSWGNNQYGALGRGYSGPNVVFTGTVYQDKNMIVRKSPFVQKIFSVFAGTDFSFAVDIEGGLWGWGYNEYGHLGNGEKQKVNHTPLLLNKEIRIAYMEMVNFSNKVLALDEDGKIWIWGYTGGDIGKNIAQTELENFTLTPVQIMPDLRCSFISARLVHAIAYTMDGELIGWGSDSNGVLAKELGADRESLEKRTVDRNYTQIAVVGNTALAIDEDGKLWAWGDSAYYGNGVTESGATPVAVMPEKNFTDIEANTRLGVVYAIDMDGKLWGWGSNIGYLLGDGTTGSSHLPILIQPNIRFVSISSAFAHTLAIDKEGKIWAWGSNHYGELGDGTNLERTTPVCLETEATFMQVAAGYIRSAAIDTEGKLWVWGKHGLSEGNGKNLAPIQVEKECTFTQVSAGEEHVLALDVNGKLWVWGRNNCGQLATGEIDSSRAYQMMAVMPEITFFYVKAFENSCYAIDVEGRLWMWGNGADLAGGDNVDKATPIMITTGEKLVAIAIGNAGLLISQSGNIWGWGSMSYGLLCIDVPLIYTPMKIILE